MEKETTISMTYENFVTDPDTGDSFTTSLIDILVKVCLPRPSVARSCVMKLTYLLFCRKWRIDEIERRLLSAG